MKTWLQKPPVWFPYLMLLVCLAAWLGPIFRPGALASDAHPSRLAEVISEWDKALLQQHWIAGWDQRIQCGYPVGTYQYQLGYVAMYALRVVGVPLALGYKLVFFFSMWLVAAVLYRWWRGFLGVWLALGLTLAFFNSQSIVHQIAQGFWNHVLGLGMLVVLLRQIEGVTHLRARDALALMALYALVVLAHNYSALAAGCFLLGALPYWWRRGGLRAVGWWVLVPVGAILLTSAYSLPLARANDWLVKVDSARPRLDHFLSVLLPFLGLDGLSPYISRGLVGRVASVVGEWPTLLAIALSLSLVALRPRIAAGERRLLGALLIALAPLLFINLHLLHWVPVGAVQRASAQLIPERFMQYTHLIVYTLAGLALRHWLDLLWALAGAPPVKSRLVAAVPRLAVGGLVLLLLLTTAKTANSLRANHRLTTTTQFKQGAQLEQLWGWLARRAGGRYRVLVETPYENYPTLPGAAGVLAQSTVMALGPVVANYYSAGDLLNLVLPMHERTRMGNGRMLNVKVAEAQPGQFAPALIQGNFGYVAACSPALTTYLAADPGFVPEPQAAAETGGGGGFEVFRFQGAPGNWAECSDGTPVEFTFDPANDARMTARAVPHSAGAELTVRVAQHPFWKARVNGTPVDLTAGAFGMLHLRLPAAGPQVVEFEYSACPAAFKWLMLLAWLGLAAGWMALRRRPGASQA